MSSSRFFSGYPSVAFVQNAPEGNAIVGSVCCHMFLFRRLSPLFHRALFAWIIVYTGFTAVSENVIWNCRKPRVAVFFKGGARPNGQPDYEASLSRLAPMRRSLHERKKHPYIPSFPRPLQPFTKKEETGSPTLSPELPTLPVETPSPESPAPTVTDKTPTLAPESPSATYVSTPPGESAVSSSPLAPASTPAPNVTPYFSTISPQSASPDPAFAAVSLPLI